MIRPFWAAIALMFCELTLGTNATAKVVKETNPLDAPNAFAFSVGELEGDAEICSAPPTTYESTVSDALALLQRIYSNAGLNASDIEQAVAAGKSNKLVLHQTYLQATNCPGFRRQVSYIRRAILRAEGKPLDALPPVAPLDALGWQGRVQSAK